MKNLKNYLQESVFDDHLTNDLSTIYSLFGKSVKSIIISNTNDIAKGFSNYSKRINKIELIDGDYNKKRFTDFFIKILSVILQSSCVYVDEIKKHPTQTTPIIFTSNKDLYSGLPRTSTYLEKDKIQLEDTPKVNGWIIGPYSNEKHWKHPGFEIKLEFKTKYTQNTVYIFTNKSEL